MAALKDHNDAVLRLARQQHDALPDDQDALPGAPSVPGVDVFAAPSLPDRKTNRNQKQERNITFLWKT